MIEGLCGIVIYGALFMFALMGVGWLIEHDAL
jgi:hypothetical protein